MIDQQQIPALLNFDTAIDWPARWSREGLFLTTQLATGPSRRVVDLGSGTGECASWLAAQGFSVVGIEGVAERWEAACADAPSGVEHLLGDCGAVEAMVRGQFGAALCLGNTLPSLIGTETVARMLSGLRRRLLPGGPVVVHVLNYDRLFACGECVTRTRSVAADDSDLIFVRTLEPRDDGVVKASDVVVELGRETDAEPRVVHRRRFFQQGWRSTEIVTLLEIARFGQVELYGGFGKQSFTAESSENLIVVAS